MQRLIHTLCGLLAPAILLGSVPARSAAAQAELRGRVLADSTQIPIAGALVFVLGTSLGANTDSLGRFALTGVPAGFRTIVVQAIGWARDSSEVEFTPGLAVFRDFRLVRANVSPEPVRGITTLDYVRVAAEAERRTPAKMAAFEERRRMGIGHFIDRAMLDRSAANRMSNVLSEVPGVQVRSGRTTRAWLASGRAINLPGGVFERGNCGDFLDRADCAAGAKPACYLDVYLDGALVFDSSSRGVPLFDINSLQPGTIEGIEVYSSASQIPAQYNRTGGGCGVMLIWTRT
jgi:hypothetical protein